MPSAVKYRKFKITFQFTHLSSCHPSNCKKGFVKGEALRLLRTNSVRENFEQSKRDLRVKFTDRKEALRNKTKQTKEVLPFVTTYNPATPNLKKILMKHWHIIQQQPKLKQIFNQPPIVSYRKEKSLKDILAREKIPSTSQESQNQRVSRKRWPRKWWPRKRWPRKRRPRKRWPRKRRPRKRRPRKRRPRKQRPRKRRPRKRRQGRGSSKD